MTKELRSIHSLDNILEGALSFKLFGEVCNSRLHIAEAPEARRRLEAAGEVLSPPFLKGDARGRVRGCVFASVFLYPTHYLLPQKGKNNNNPVS